MIEFLNVLSIIIYVVFIVSSVLFGFSIAVKIYVLNVAKKIVNESGKNYENIEDYYSSKMCEKIISKHALRYDNYANIEKKNLKIKRGNKVRKFFKLKERNLLSQNDSLKDISISLFSEISNCFEGSGGYLNYSKNEIISMLKVLVKRLNAICLSSNVIWLKTIKISSLAHVVSITKNFEKFKGKTSIIILTYVLEFAFFLSRIFSPASASKLLANNLMGNTFKSLLISSVFSVIGREWAVLCYQKQCSRREKSSGKKVA